MAQRKINATARAQGLGATTADVTVQVTEIHDADFAGLNCPDLARFCKATCHGMAARTRTGKRTLVTFRAMPEEAAAIRLAVKAGHEKTRRAMAERAKEEGW